MVICSFSLFFLLCVYNYVCRCIIKGEPVNLSVREKPRPTEDVPCTLSVSIALSRHLQL